LKKYEVAPLLLAWQAKPQNGSVNRQEQGVRCPPDKRRPVLLLTRDEVIEQLGEIIAAPVTRTIRGLATEVVLTSDDGMPVACAANFDHVGLAQRARVGG
jgi:mRNA-degrading endonuclease toxin of MazEF toxin-antitoxin module